ncbi:hypothetical protein B296_00051088, partial [Ensete ventricosum]
ESARLIVLGIAVGVGAVILEEPGVVGRQAAAGVAAVLVRLEHGAGVVAAARRLQRSGALPVDVRRAPDAAAAARRGAEVHGHVEAVDQGDVEEVEVVKLVERELGQGVGRAAVRRACQHAAAVARLALPAAAPVEGAAGAAPDAAAGRSCIHVDGPRLPLVELLSAAGHGRGPHCVSALVHDLEGGGMGEGDKKEEEGDGENA